MREQKLPKARRGALPQTAEPVPPAPELPRAATAPEAVVAELPEPRAVAALPTPARVADLEGSAEGCFAAYRATLSSIGESQAAIASDMAAMALEMSGLARANMTAAGESVVAMLTAHSLADAVEAQLGFARRGLDALAGGSMRLGELGLRLADDAAKPMVRALAAV